MMIKGWFHDLIIVIVYWRDYYIIWFWLFCWSVVLCLWPPFHHQPCSPLLERLVSVPICQKKRPHKPHKPNRLCMMSWSPPCDLASVSKISWIMVCVCVWLIGRLGKYNLKCEATCTEFLDPGRGMKGLINLCFFMWLKTLLLYILGVFWGPWK